MSKWMTAAVAACFVSASLVGARAEPLATDLVGTWSCAPATGGPAFRWTVTDELPGGWLVGRGYEDGNLTSLEAWAHDGEGRLTTRRQFSPNGRFIELNVSERSDNAVTSSGTVLERDGTTIEVEHALTRIDQNRLGAVWRARIDGQWSVVADEICSRVAP